MRFIRGKQPSITAMLAVIGAGAAYAVGDVTGAQAAQTAITAILAATLRHGMG